MTSTPFTPSPEMIEALKRKMHQRGLTQFYEPDAIAAIAVIAPMLGEDAAKVGEYMRRISNIQEAAKLFQNANRLLLKHDSISGMIRRLGKETEELVHIAVGCDTAEIPAKELRIALHRQQARIELELEKLGVTIKQRAMPAVLSRKIGAL